VVLEQVCQYLYYNDRYKGMTSVPDMEIPPELSLELALAADFLECRCNRSQNFADAPRLMMYLNE
jgi:hypothetical protein